MGREITIIIPSLREKLLQRRISEWEESNTGVDYEIIVISPFQVFGGKITWIKDNPPFKGSVNATDKGCAIAQGKYIVYMSDDVKPTKGCLRNIIEFMDKQKIHPFLGAFKMIKPNGSEIGPFGVYNRFYACYGCISKEDLMLLYGTLFKPSFKYSWADCDLSLRIWDKKGEVKICNNAIVIPEQENDEIYKEHRRLFFQQDVDTFLGIWHGRLGFGLEKNDGAVNKKLSIKEV